MKTTLPAELLELNVPHIGDYFGLWSMHEPIFRAAVQRAGSMNLVEHVRSSQQSDANALAAQAVMNQTIDGVAVIELRGTLMKFVGSLDSGTSTVFARRMVRAAAADPQVKAILLQIDSPGGTVAGTTALADEVAAAAKVKPVQAFIEDLGASAAFWIASQAGKVFAGRSAKVGSIGVYGVIYDVSAMAEKRGIKVHVVSTGQFKGAGEPGTKITPEQLAEFQRIADGINAIFVASVAAGRGLSLEAVQTLADGRVHLPADAAAQGLIDGVSTFEAVLASLTARHKTVIHAARTAAKQKVGDFTMTENNTVELQVTAVPKEGEAGAAGKQPDKTAPVSASPAASKAATIDELESAMGDASSDFKLACLKKGMTLEQAKDAWMIELREQKDRAVKAAETATAKLDAPGVEAVGVGKSGAAAASDASDPISSFEEAVAEKVKGGMDRQAAIRAAVHEDTDRHAAYVEAINERRRRAG